MKYARMSRAGGRGASGRPRSSFLQNCAVRVSYSSNQVAGHWKAHGRYLARENASLVPEQAGFSAMEAAVDVASTLQEWQSRADPRLWKLILSPEFGERIELQRLTRDFMSGMEANLGTPLDWVAVAHFNTEHPHVHIALRGLDKNGVEFKLPRDYVQNGLRAVAQHCVTVQIGHRTEQDASLAYQRQVPEQRLTPLDRIILRRMDHASAGSMTARIAVNPARAGLGKFGSIREQSIEARIRMLRGMGLAQLAAETEWDVRRDFADVLRSMQRASDHQKTLAAHGALLSDQRLQLSAPKWKDISSVEGRVLSHGEGETGNRFLLLEGTDGRVYHLAYTPELEEARAHGGLRTNSFAVITKSIDENRKRRITALNLGDAETLLNNAEHFQSLAKRLLRKGVLCLETERWNGWLGQYQKRIEEAMVKELNSPSRPRNHSQKQER